jgi:hypothetical protein
VREKLEPNVAEKFERFVKSKFCQNRIIDPIQQENIVLKLAPFEPDEQIEILEYNTGTPYPQFYIPDSVNKKVLERSLAEELAEREARHKADADVWMKNTVAQNIAEGCILDENGIWRKPKK